MASLNCPLAGRARVSNDFGISREAQPVRARIIPQAPVRCQASPLGNATAEASGSATGQGAPAGKCPFAGIAGSTKGLLKGNGAVAEALEMPATQSFTAHKFDYTPFSGPNYQVKYKMTMGLEPMDPADWIEIDEHYEEDMALRRQLVQEKRDIVIHSTPGSEAANAELLELLVDFLPSRFPDRFTRDGDAFINHATGDVWDLSDPSLDPLEVSALLVQEDLCLMTTDSEGVLRFVSGAVLFPQRWSLIEKIGMDMRRIHDPVPIFNKEILKPVSAFMNRITPTRPFWRANWTISDNPELFQPLVEENIRAANAGEIINDRVWGEREPVTAENAGDRLSTRCERETLSRFPKTGAILFSIRTHQRQLSTFEGRPDKAWELARALRNLPQEVVAYKTVAAFKEQALEYLDRISAGMSEATPRLEPFLP